MSHLSPSVPSVKSVVKKFRPLTLRQRRRTLANAGENYYIDLEILYRKRCHSVAIIKRVDRCIVEIRARIKQLRRDQARLETTKP